VTWVLAGVLAACDARPLPVPVDLALTLPDGGVRPAEPGFAAEGFVGARGADLVASGRRFRFVGANRYDVASFPPGSGKFACNRAYSDDELERLLGELVGTGGVSVLRAWAFQSYTDGARDWSAFDRLVAAAARHRVRLVLTLENEWRDCTEPDPATADGSKGAGWYQGGYLQPLGLDRLSYREYVGAVTWRYREEPTIAFWQLMNEAESPDADALYAFAADMASVVRFFDPHHLVSLGTIGAGQPGTGGARYAALHALAGIDLVEAHDYGDERTPLPPAIAADLLVAAQLGKPFFIGEAGIDAPPPPYAFTFEERAHLFDEKIGAHWQRGTAGFLVWSFYQLEPATSGWDYAPGDPLAEVLARRGAE
jgi:hypothetical protein